MTTASEMVPHDEFAEGFKVGFHTVQGVVNKPPAVSAKPATPRAMTPFLMCVRAGIKAAVSTLTQPTNATPPIR